MGCVGARQKPALPEVRPRRGRFHAENVVAKKLGKGAYASVYAVSKAVGEEPKYAAKVVCLHGEASSTPEMVSRELQILQKVSDTRSKFVVQFVESFVEGHFVYMVMEKCDQSLLGALTSLPNITEATYRPMFRQMAKALEIIHSAGVVHRDVKPDNFMCVAGGDGRRLVKLCDFGLATVVSDASREELKGINGTAPFLAPEMVKGSRYGAKVDTWSLGVIFYLLLFGHFPYMPLEWTTSEMKRAIREGLPAPPFAPRVKWFAGDEDMEDALSLTAEDFVVHLLIRLPRDRPTAAEALRHEFFAGPSQSTGRSLRPMLESARHCGAFDLPREKEEVPSEVDVALAALQVRHGHDSPWSRQTTASSECSSEPLTPETPPAKSKHQAA